ncbi:MAG: 16S rRNA (cytidine(1402)-2'-O)-methyltransferase [Spirochaetes bacterium GWD1_27_9]|nr:MAG: 16S rRNA (cytidine(1402)-2'-O)-methyltransferase [Spirochaetes bacterium GWB1_27_13]OHD25845.1 MAG: 16S rRNA (cytidine(1402)-2'-O)-methyltransferase [Spirochaetes bacterium GWC1_27_15]OHD30355.1 MAG: 16S rRNA (cytidine(1402)-2'-O)-methyltransferase [Spirochaetes bacterium GWD1_27_9]
METITPSTLYIVSTPIGNLMDITLRALEVLKNVDVIACEDTRHSLKLLNHYEIKKHLISYHSYNEKNSTNGIIKLLAEGKSLALISDGGTPCISDPGYLLIKECIKEGFKVVPIPGASGFLTLLVASGFRTDSFYFHGFLSPKEGRRKKQLEEMKLAETTHIIYESPYRILKLLQNIDEIFCEKLICTGKELTKINENILISNAKEIKEKIEKEKILGEFIILIANY